MTRFEGKVAVITGSGRGIGAATAARLAREGAAVVVSDMDAKATAETADRIAGEHGKAKGIPADVTDRESVENLVKGTVDAFGRLDVLVCCAGIIRDNLIYKMTDEDWDGVIDTHLKGTFFAAREAQKVMVPQKYGRMVFMSSTSALGNRGQTNYSTAKAGLQGMARTLAIELGRYNITVNAIAPGFIETAMTRQTADRMGMDFEQFKQGAATQIPVARIGQPEDIAAAVAYLASEEAGFVSGQTLYVRGGP
ncbi:MAG TPA: 3-oxoacyl-ACP reductase FabG [Candidatus Dormibacteraeota bacterium]